MKFYGIRGAITVTGNEREIIISQTKKLLTEILKRNSLKLDNIVSIFFSCTDDITAVYPAVAARELGMISIPLMCCQEMKVENSLRLCIRVLINVQTEKEFLIKHVYLDKAELLRPDLVRQGGAGNNTITDNHNIGSQTSVKENNNTKNMAIAIDGPAGAGKSTIAKLLAKKLGMLYLDTGAMYRAMALKILNENADPGKRESVIPYLSDTDIRIEYKNCSQIVILDGKDVTNLIRTAVVTQASSAIAVIPEVREKLVEIQREIANNNSVVMDGRDIGTYVLPNAERKFFLTASVEERALRRYKENKEKGKEADYAEILKDIKQRDKNDSSREFAPLKKAEDAVLIDSTGKSIDEVVELIFSYI